VKYYGTSEGEKSIKNVEIKKEVETALKLWEILGMIYAIRD